MTRKAWNDDEGKLVTIPSSGIDPLAPVDPSERRPDPMSFPCAICNARPYEKCASIIDARLTLAIPHFSRGRS